MRWVLVAALLGLAGCGADGDPIKPEAKAGVTIGSDGVKASGKVSASSGPVTVVIGL